MRQGFAEIQLAHLFKISQSTVSRIFISWINFMYLRHGQISLYDFLISLQLSIEGLGA